MQCHREKRAKAFASMAREKPWQRTFGLLAVAALALVAHGASAAAPLVPLDRNPTELLSRDWLQGNVGAPGRRITTKSIFIVPERSEGRDCPQGTWRSAERCVPFLHLDEETRVQLLLDRLNVQYGTAQYSEPNSEEGYDYEETIPEAQGPLQVNIPLLPQLIGAVPPRAITPEPASNDKLILTSSNNAVSTDNKENKKVQNATELQNSSTLVDQLESLKGDTNNRNPIDSIVSMDGNIAVIDKYILGASETEESTENITEQIDLNHKKHVENEPNHSSLTMIQETILENATSSTMTNTPDMPDNITESSKMTSEKSSYLKNKIKDKIKYDEHLLNKLRPELDYSDLSETIKIISRFAEITTDDMFKKKNVSRDPYYTELNENPLGTRTKLEHFKKLSRYNKSATNTRIEVKPLERIELDDNPLVQLNPNRMEFIKREIKDSWQIHYKQESHVHQSASREDHRDLSRHHDQRTLPQNPIRHRKLQNVRRGRSGHAA